MHHSTGVNITEDEVGINITEDEVPFEDFYLHCRVKDLFSIEFLATRSDYS